ncbi:MULTISPECIES: energy-coupling factor transporter transmembrane protein EcfT [unclassified Paenibacillus]|uniref:energy-coupling factor transporter transmembrane component T family protein n=1 Tax=unclassified Paenibacillus TaxID=185978 RepID=UPI001C0F4962|nr:MULTISPECIES: energy-coupling factor transporter transmembrane component T [unclassified Paenibacillus]MBU5443336.1 energy-coupling factor transporter transmembrane protein EcfT [Paenibacillus sp. MSJ-34]CAH0118891.1 Putative HMP/thiamine permease protein YkoC [Paenibacillus sp. CECT 9249]
MTFQFQPGNSPFHRLDPLTKIIWVLCVSVLTLRYTTALPQAILLAAVLLAAIALAGLRVRVLMRSIRVVLWLSIPYFVLQLLWIPGSTALLRLGPLEITAEALDYSLGITLRLLILFASSLIYIATTDPQDVVLMLAQKLKLPYRFAFGISIALRFVPFLEEEAATIRAAQAIRGLRPAAGWRERWQRWKIFVAAVFTNAVRRIQTTANAMDMKGFGAHESRTYMRSIAVRRSSVLFAAATIAATIAILAVY